MNNLSVTLSESTIKNFLRAQLANITFQNEEKKLYDDNGMKIVANVKIKRVEFDDFVLTPPDTFTIKKISVEFETLNIIVSADLKEIHERKVIDVPDIPEIKDPITGRVLIPGRVTPDIVLWDFTIFENNPDVALTIGLEKFVKPVCSASFNFIFDDFKASLGLKDFEMNDFVLPENIAEQVKNEIVEEIKKKLKEKVGENFGKLLDYLGDLLKIIPVPDVTGLIIDTVIKNDEFEKFVASQINSKLGKYVLYVPQNLRLGTEQSPIELSIGSSAINVTENKELKISVDINELQ